MKSNEKAVAWYEKHASKLYGYARLRIMHENELEQVISEAASIAFEAVPLSESDSADKHDSAWLLAILRKQIRSHYRQKYETQDAKLAVRSKAKEILDRPFKPDIDFDKLHTDLLNQFDHATFNKAAHECLSMLDPMHAEIYILRELEDVSVEEICGIFGLIQSDVLDLVFRGRMQFVKCLLIRLPGEHSQ